MSLTHQANEKDGPRRRATLKSTDVIDVLSDLFILRGVPGHIRSDNGPEFIAQAVREWIGDCRKFRVWAGIVGKKETPHAPTQTACDRRLAA